MVAPVWHIDGEEKWGVSSHEGLRTHGMKHRIPDHCSISFQIGYWLSSSMNSEEPKNSKSTEEQEAQRWPVTEE